MAIKCDTCDDRPTCDVYAAYSAALIANEMYRADWRRHTRQMSMTAPTAEADRGYYY